MKRCRNCNETKPRDAFYRENRRKDGLRDWCKQCDKVYDRAARLKWSDEKKARVYAQNRAYYAREENRIKAYTILLFNGVKQRCRKKGYDNEVTKNFISTFLEIGRCWATGFLFKYEKSKRGGITPFSPSIDRIRSDNGYVVGNVQVVCSMYNVGKGGHDELDFIAMCLAVADRNKNNSAAIARMHELRGDA